ncbi:MAG TPA: TIGR03085 family metal-binding protein [Streptosporangiaceae bacterium]|nr:TIGR03085 family metal-binding protein [Streptosporangiaceae bacterium]
MGYSRDERLALCALLDEAGPDAPTLCEGWTTRDLAAHLVLRERRPDAAAGILGGPLAAYTARVQQRLSAQTPYRDLVEAIRNGPPKLSVWAIPGMEEQAGIVEYFVHHEDVRRAAPGWEPRDIGPGLADALWARLRMARFTLRKVPVGVEFARDDTGGEGGSAAFRMTVRQRTPVVTVIGSPAELTMWASGRVSAARVRMDGAEAAVSTLTQARWRL